MNICFYTDQAISGMTGGIGRVTSVLTEHFRHDYGWSVYSIYGREASADCVLTPTDGSICLRLHNRLGFRRLSGSYRTAIEWLLAHHVDVLIVQTSLDVVARMRRQIAQHHASIRIYSVLHFEPGKDEWPWRGGNVMRRIVAPIRNLLVHRATISAYRQALLQGDGVSVLSPSYVSLYRQYCGLYEGGNLFALANPLSFASVYSASELPGKKRVLLVVARMEEQQKRISHILQLWGQIPHQGYTLKLVGDGPSLPAYRQLADTLQLADICFEGRQQPEPYYREAAIFLMTSRFEGFPMTLVEAQQFGCVPIAYNAFSALADVVVDGQNGLVITNEDTDAFRRALCSLMSDTDRRRLLAEGALTSCQRFSQDTICREWHKILEA